MTKTQFYGSIPALITPFANGEVDFKAFENFVEWQIAEGSHGLVPCGTTGETPTLEKDEHHRIIERCVQVVKGRVKVIAGTGSNSTVHAIELTRMAEALGVDAALVVTPYYNKPTQEGLYQHFKAIHDSTSLPIILYAVPGRTGVELSVDTVLRLSELPRIAGIKDAHTDLNRPAYIRRAVRDDFAVLSGEDGTCTAFYAQGGDGCISVTANIAPHLCAEQYNAWVKGDFKTVSKLRNQLMPLHKAMFVETSPAPVKYAASVLGLARDEVRMPLVAASLMARQAVDEAISSAGLVVPAIKNKAA